MDEVAVVVFHGDRQAVLAIPVVLWIQGQGSVRSEVGRTVVNRICDARGQGEAIRVIDEVQLQGQLRVLVCLDFRNHHRGVRGHIGSLSDRGSVLQHREVEGVVYFDEVERDRGQCYLSEGVRDGDAEGIGAEVVIGRGVTPCGLSFSCFVDNEGAVIGQRALGQVDGG